MFKKIVRSNAKGHLLGRLSSYIAKALLNGTFSLIQDKVAVVRTEGSISPVYFSEKKSYLHNS